MNFPPFVAPPFEPRTARLIPATDRVNGYFLLKTATPYPLEVRRGRVFDLMKH